MHIRNIFTVIVLLIFSTFSCFGQEWQWVTKIGKGDDYNRASIIFSRTDKTGNTYVAGWFTGTLTLGDKVYKGYFYSYNTYYIVKYDPHGKILWSRTFKKENPNNYLNLEGLATDDLGNVYLRSALEGGVLFDDGTSITLPFWQSGSSFVCKFNSLGQIEWKRFRDSGTKVTSNGSLFSISELIENYPKDFPEHNDANSLFCYNSSAQLKWKKEYEFKRVTSPNDYTTTDNNRLWTITQMADTLEVMIENKSVLFIPGDVVIAEYSEADGKLISFKKTKDLFRPYFDNLKIKDNFLYIMGSFQDNNSPSITFGDTVLTTSKPEDQYEYGNEGFLAKYDISSGQYVWAIRISSINTNGGYNHLNVSSKGNIFLGIRPNQMEIGHIYKYNAEGHLLWTRETKADIHNYSSVGLDHFENVYLPVKAVHGARTGIMSFGTKEFPFVYEVGFVAKLSYTDISNCITNTQMNASICSGESFQFGNRELYTSGIYKDTLISSTGCDSIVTATLTVESITAEIIEDGKRLKAMPGGDSYQWIDCSTNTVINQNSQYLSPTTAGRYTVKITKNGCSSTSSCFEKIIKEAQNISFSDINDQVYGQDTITLQATSSSSLPVEFTLVSGPARMIDSNKLSITGVGQVEVKAKQPGNAYYLAATEVSKTFLINKATQTIAFTSIGDKFTNDTPFELSATSTSGLAVYFTVISGPAKLSGNTLTLLGEGEVTVKAIQTGNEFYLPTSIEQTFVIQLVSGIEPEESTVVNVYPNPASSYLYVMIPASFSNVEIELIDKTGKIVKQQNFHFLGFIQLPTNDLSSGVYLLRITHSQGSTSKKVVIY